MSRRCKRVWGGTAVLLVMLGACDYAESDDVSIEVSKQRIIYGADDRVNIAQHLDQRAALWSNSVGILAEMGTLCDVSGSSPTCEPLLLEASTLIAGGDVDPPPGPLCPDQSFINERILQDPCTAFYVGNDLFITAAHCIESSDCGTGTDEDKGVLMGFTTDVLGSTPDSLPRDGNLYRCQSIVQRELQVFDPGRIDYAIFEVTPPVTGHRPLKLRRSGAVSAGPPAESTPATPLGIVGHGLGLPMKASLYGQVRNNVNTAFFYHTIDSFPGDSGAPVINLQEGIVEGIHAAGPIPQSGVPPQLNLTVRNQGTANECLAYTTCAENACPANEVNRQWSQATRITRTQILNAVPPLPTEEAEIPDEHVMIVLDRTGSMTAEGTTPNLTRWDEAINAAMGWVGVDSLTASLFRRAYSVWTFRTGQGQSGLQQVWPNSTGTNCSNVDSDTGFCVFEPVTVLATPTDYLALQAELENIREIHRPVTGPATPLAESLCEALEILRSLPPLRRIIFQADGGENASSPSHPCAGVPSQPFDNPFDNPTLFAEPDWGMTSDSWQAKVIRRATRLDQLIEDAVDGALSAIDRFPVTLIWNVDVHFALEPTPQTATFSLLSSGSSPMEWEGVMGHGFGVALLATIANQPVSSTDILPAELSLFGALGSSNATSTLTTYARPLEPIVYGVDHALQGDVDDSGCVDQADLSIMTQGDVWMKRAVLPLQIAMRADLNRDGWVNFADLQILLAHYASGCINPVAPPDLGGIVLPSQGTCDDGLLNGDETDVDCGGGCGACPDGASCAGPTDCASGACTSNICQAEPPLDMCECRPNKCNDCTNPITACEATPGCTSIVACTLEYPCSFPHENCNSGQSCHQITGYAQSSPAGQAANNVISCFGGC